LVGGEQEGLHHSSGDSNVLIRLLGDAWGIFKKNKLQGTSIVMKTINNTSGP
jgi:hypothetical protein